MKLKIKRALIAIDTLIHAVIIHFTAQVPLLPMIILVMLDKFKLTACQTKAELHQFFKRSTEPLLYGLDVKTHQCYDLDKKENFEESNASTRCQFYVNTGKENVDSNSTGQNKINKP